MQKIFSGELKSHLLFFVSTTTKNYDAKVEIVCGTIKDYKEEMFVTFYMVGEIKPHLMSEATFEDRGNMVQLISRAGRLYTPKCMYVCMSVCLYVCLSVGSNP